MGAAEVEIVRRGVEALNGGTPEAGDLAPDCEWVVAAEHPEATTHRGPQAILAYLADWRRLVPDMRFEVDEYIDGGERVAALGRFSGSGAGSGAGAPIAMATVSTVRGGRIVRVEEFLDPQAAREALGRDA